MVAIEQDKAIPVPARNKERIFLLLITIIFSLFFYRLHTVLQERFADVDKRLADGTMVDLNAKDPARNLRRLLERGYYFEDKRDIDLVEASVANSINTGEQIDNIGELNKSRYYIEADKAFEKGGKSFKARVTASRSLLGYTGDDSLRFVQERRDPPSLPAVNDLSMGSYSINGRIVNKENAVPGVLVRLQMILPQDSIYSDEPIEDIRIIRETTPGVLKTYIPDTAGQRRLQDLTAYARTDANGNFSFKNLPGAKAFKVLPLQPGYQFGTSQGVQSLDEDVSFTFNQSPHTIRLFSTRDFSILKKEKSLIIRTPEEFNLWFWITAGCFIAGFVILHLILSRWFRSADQLILPAIMMLTGLSFLTMLSLQDPLRDRFLAKDSLVYLGLGLGAMLVMLLLKLRRFNTDSWVYRMLLFKNVRSAANGWPWIALAMTLLALTIKFGTGPEGSGVKVNLFGFQPSEIVKYLIIFFLAGFFAVNEKLISEYASWTKRWSFFSFALIAILVTLLLFLLLGDLGPAMVVCFTFITLFSFSRGDFMFMAIAVVIYVIVSWIFKNVWLSAAITAGIVALLMLFQRRQMSESAVMVLVIMAAFLTIDQVPYLGKLFPGPVQRLVDRKAIWQDAWNNEVYGGDHVANGIWAMSSGGISGQGVGEGFAKTIPEAHTDMILPSMGEEFGWTGIVCIFLLFLL
ncbi:MAG: FtsW/RodA/SpoVE family cell cycle protein, partial [Sphingobacteriales bacterium]